MNSKITLGQAGEDLVANYLVNNGFTIIERNYRKQYGEIDLIAINKEIIAFVEVKRRIHTYQGLDLSEVVTFSKQQKMIKVAKHYLAYGKHDTKNCRFDIALIEGQENNVKLTYIPHAFEGSEF